MWRAVCSEPENTDIVLQLLSLQALIVIHQGFIRDLQIYTTLKDVHKGCTI